MVQKSSVKSMTLKGDAQLARPLRSKLPWALIGVIPFYLFAFAFLFVPSFSIVVRSFTGRNGGFTLANFQELLSRADLLRAYQTTINISIFTAVIGGIFGFLLAYSVTMGGLPRFLRSFLLTFSGVASNFAGVPLAFAFIATMGQTGLITRLIDHYFNLNLYKAGFTVYSFWGLSLVYLYFQFPLMVLVITPSLDGLRREWKEAAENLGASPLQYWRYVALPILLPSLLGTMILLFGNSFGAYATAYALTGTMINLVPIVIGANIQGDVLYNPGLGNALALGMVVIMAVCIAGYTSLQRKTERWLR